MRQPLAALCLAFGLLLLSPSDGRSAIETKLPDLGNYWFPLNPTSGTYVYANSFVAPTTGVVTTLGTWLDDLGTGGSQIRLQVLGSLGGNVANGPDTSALLATTAVLGPFTGSLAFYSAPDTGSSATLIGGQTYWFAANVIGLTGPGYYQVGGHTQGADNGTFWYSNDSTGASYEGQRLTPEMAFSVTVEPSTGVVPEATGFVVWSVLGTVCGGSWWLRRRTA